MKKSFLCSLVLLTMSSSALAFDFDLLPGQYGLMENGTLEGRCPSALSILEQVPGLRSYHVYNLDLTGDEAHVSVVINQKEVGKGWVRHTSAGEKSRTKTVIREGDENELVWIGKGRFFLDEGNRIPAPMRSYVYSFVIAQGDNPDVLAISQHRIRGKRVAEELECLYLRLR